MKKPKLNPQEIQDWLHDHWTLYASDGEGLRLWINSQGLFCVKHGKRTLYKGTQLTQALAAWDAAQKIFKGKMTEPEYITPQGFRCPKCGELCKIIPLRNEFDYTGTHCTHGLPETHYPDNWGDPSCDACGATIKDFDWMSDENYYD